MLDTKHSIIQRLEGEKPWVLMDCGKSSLQKDKKRILTGITEMEKVGCTKKCMTLKRESYYDVATCMLFIIPSGV